MIDRRTLLKGLAAIAALPVLAGCSERNGAHASEDAFFSDHTVLSYRLAVPRGIDPYDADAAGLAVTYQLFDQLTRFDYQAGEMRPWAAESVVSNDAATQFTFRLRAGQTFSTGEALRSADFKRAWERLVAPGDAVASGFDATSPWAYLLTLVDGYDELSNGSASELAGVTCPDVNTLQVTLKTPYADFPLLCAHPALSPVPEAALGDSEAFRAKPIGNGPFALHEAWDGAGDIRLTRWRDAAAPAGAALLDETADGEQGQFDGIAFVLEDDISAAYKQLEAGNIDVAAVPVDQLEEAEKTFGPRTEGIVLQGDGHLLSSNTTTVNYLVCNTGEPPFDNADVRRALSLAIDRETLCDKVFRGAHAPAASVVAPCIPVDGTRDWEYAAYDPDRAKRLLEPLYPAGKDGARELEVSLAYSKGGTNAKLIDALAADFKAVGVSVKTEAVDWQDLVRRYRTGDFSCGRMSWTPDAPSLDGVLYPLFRSGIASAGNYARYANGETDALLDAAREATDPAARRSLLSRVAAQVGKDCPVIPLTFAVQTYATSERVARLAIDSQGDPYLAGASLA